VFRDLDDDMVRLVQNGPNGQRLRIHVVDDCRPLRVRREAGALELRLEFTCDQSGELIRPT
jgi:hypothetical protein